MAKKQPSKASPTRKVAGVAAYTALQTPWGNRARSRFYSQGRKSQAQILRGKGTAKDYVVAGAYTTLQTPWGSRARARFYTRSSRARAKAIEAGGNVAARKVKAGFS